MLRQAVLNELKIRKEEILAELEAIDKIIASNTIVASSSENLTKFERTKGVGTSKGKMSWQKYVIVILREIGGKGKTKDVVAAIVKANPKSDEIRTRNAVRHHLSKLNIDGTIGAIKSKIKSEGYEYYIKE